MSWPFICSRCRLESTLKRQTRPFQHQRSWLTYGSQHAESSTTNASLEGDANTLGSPVERPLQGRPSRGRYSRLPLAPEQLLRELNESAEVAHRRKPRLNYRPLATRKVQHGRFEEGREDHLNHFRLRKPFGAFETPKSPPHKHVSKIAADALLESIRGPTQAGESNALATLVASSITRLGRAVEQSNLRSVERVRDDVNRFKAHNPSTPIPPEVYEVLMQSFGTLRDLRSMIAVCKVMAEDGHAMTIKTYSIMMHASHHSRDLVAMENFWTQMRKAGLKPDTHAWTTRIFGLLSNRRYLKTGMQALDEMATDWIKAAQLAQQGSGQKAVRTSDNNSDSGSQLTSLLSEFQGSVDGVPRPGVEVVNSAISALAMHDNSLIPKVLSWARLFDIEPNLRTYNALINLSLRKNMPEEAMSILKRMNEKGVEADSSTWTVLLTALFNGGSLEGMSSTEVIDRISQFVDSIEGNVKGKLDEKSYALIIDRILKNFNDHDAAQVFLDRMISKGMDPNAEIFTILMTAHLRKSPPNFAAAANLWSSMKSARSGYGFALDSMFFDRMIELYAPHHATIGLKPVLEMFETMESQKKRPSWRALEALARALAEAGEWQRLSQIVERAKRERDGQSAEFYAYGARSFWDFISATGLPSGKSTSRTDEPAQATTG